MHLRTTAWGMLSIKEVDFKCSQQYTAVNQQGNLHAWRPEEYDYLVIMVAVLIHYAVSHFWVTTSFLLLY
jgi:hypothetical protein